MGVWICVLKKMKMQTHDFCTICTDCDLNEDKNLNTLEKSERTEIIGGFHLRTPNIQFLEDNGYLDPIVESSIIRAVPAKKI